MIRKNSIWFNKILNHIAFYLKHIYIIYFFFNANKYFKY